jgi:hypothetical protein
MTSAEPRGSELEPMTAPLAGSDAQLDSLLGTEGPALRLWAPVFVALDREDAPSLAVGATGPMVELHRLRMERRAFVVAVDVERGDVFVARPVARDGAPQRLSPPPGFEGGLGPAQWPRSAQVVKFAMWERGAAWAPGTYALVAVAADRVSHRVEVVVGRARSTVDPAAESVAPDSLRVWPPPDPGGQLPHYHPLAESPALPAEPGIALVVPRVVREGRVPIHGSFRVRLHPRWIVPHGATVPVTLVLTGSEDPRPIVIPLRLPSFDRVDRASPPTTVTGRFAFDLMQLAPLAAAPQTWFLHAFSSDVSTGPVMVAVVAPDDQRGA